MQYGGQMTMLSTCQLSIMCDCDSQEQRDRRLQVTCSLALADAAATEERIRRAQAVTCLYELLQGCRPL